MAESHEDRIAIPADPKSIERLADMLDPEGVILGENPLERLKMIQEHPVPLHPDLVPYRYEDERFGHTIKHPLLFSMMHADFQNGMVNQQYKAKKQYTEEKLAEGNYSGAVWMHERPYRLDAFMRYAPKMSDHDYWDLLGSLWSDSENIWQNFQLWRLCLESDRPERDAFMDEEEHAKLAELRNAGTPVAVYRGYCVEDGREGMSYTMDRKRAEWFARRFAGIDRADCCEVVTATIDPERIIAVKLGRGEDEIVAFPEDVKPSRIDVLDTDES